ncbi:MAG: TIGR03790 family protein [Limisphaerales bacterium]
MQMTPTVRTATKESGWWQRALLFWFGGAMILHAAGRGDSAVIIYNRRLPESKEVAEYYVARRQVPTNQVFGFDLPTTETMTRSEFRDELQKPLLAALEKHRLFTFGPETPPASSLSGERARKLDGATIRYAVLCYGVPLIIAGDPTLKEDGMDKLRPEVRRNEAAVDSELALLPQSRQHYPLYGAVQNGLYGTTNAAAINPTNGVLIVARLDGPSAAIAHGLVDKALQAENDGLWGRAYFDLRGLTNTEYKVGDDWIRTAAQIIRRFGFETVMDEKPETFPASFPMSQIALYAGWYDGNVSGPFTRPKVEFMPGAIAYHLHSFSAHSIRTPNTYWVGPLLAKGATATMGCVDEPYLEGTPDVGIFFARLVMGFTFGEAACASQSVLSWQTTVVGDPLYVPFGKTAQVQHEELTRRKSKLIEWSHLRVVNLNLGIGTAAPEMINYLEATPETAQSAVLEEKLGDLYYSIGRVLDAIPIYQKALVLDPSPQQRIRVTLRLGGSLELFDRNSQAFELYRQFLKESPDYPDLLSIHRKLLALAQTLGKKDEAEHYQREIQRLSPPTAAPAPSGH